MTQETMFHSIVDNGKNQIFQSFAFDWKKLKSKTATFSCCYSFANTSENLLREMQE